MGHNKDITKSSLSGIVWIGNGQKYSGIALFVKAISFYKFSKGGTASASVSGIISGPVPNGYKP